MPTTFWEPLGHLTVEQRARIVAAMLKAGGLAMAFAAGPVVPVSTYEQMAEGAIAEWERIKRDTRDAKEQA